MVVNVWDCWQYHWHADLEASNEEVNYWGEHFVSWKISHLALLSCLAACQCQSISQSRFISGNKTHITEREKRMHAKQLPGTVCLLKLLLIARVVFLFRLRTDQRVNDTVNSLRHSQPFHKLQTRTTRFRITVIRTKLQMPRPPAWVGW